MFDSYADFRAALGEVHTISIIARLMLSMLCGGIIGIDRARKRRPAGLRTYMLVCVGAALVMITNQYITTEFSYSDPARLGAQVISGIGFLGAGTIIVTRHHQVIGLTTAAGLWASACMGLAVGIGFYEGAIIACFFIACIVTVMHRFDNVVVANSRVMEIFVELRREGKLSDFLAYLSNHGVRVSYMELVKNAETEAEGTCALMTLRLPRRYEHTEILQRLMSIPGVNFVEEV